MKLWELYQAIDHLAPFRRAEKWDNSGLLIGDGEAEVTGVVFALDITSDVIEDAVKAKANVIVSHHPVIFEGLKRISPCMPVYQLIKNGLHAICAHTNLDVAERGVNACLAQRLGLQNIRPLVKEGRENYLKVVVFVPKEQADLVRTAMCMAGAGELGEYDCCSFSSCGTGRFRPKEGAAPFLGTIGEIEEVQEVRLEAICTPDKLEEVLAAMKKAHPYELPAYDVFENLAASQSWGLGLVGEIPGIEEPEQFALYVKQRLGCSGVRLVEGRRPLRRIAVCGGAGGSLLPDVIRQGIDGFVTADLKHNQMLDAAQAGVTLVDAGHYCTENVVVEPLMQMLQECFPELRMQIAAHNTEPSRIV